MSHPIKLRLARIELLYVSTSQLEVWVKIATRQLKIQQDYITNLKQRYGFNITTTLAYKWYHTYRRNISRYNLELDRRCNKEYGAFIRAIHEQPTESTTFLVFADWFAERGMQVEERRMRREAIRCRDPKYHATLRKTYR